MLTLVKWWTKKLKQSLEKTVQNAISENQAHGVVLCIGTDEKILYLSAFGKRREVPSTQPMEVNTIFDLASVTKVVATAPAICLLWQQGKLDINAPVKQYLPEFFWQTQRQSDFASPSDSHFRFTCFQKLPKDGLERST